MLSLSTKNQSWRQTVSQANRRIVKNANGTEINEEALGEGMPTYTGRAGKEAVTLKVNLQDQKKTVMQRTGRRCMRQTKFLRLENKNWCQFAEPCHVTSLWYSAAQVKHMEGIFWIDTEFGNQQSVSLRVQKVENMRMLIFPKRSETQHLPNRTLFFSPLRLPGRDLNVSDPSPRHGDTQNCGVDFTKAGGVWTRCKSSHHWDYIMSQKTVILYSATNGAQGSTVFQYFSIIPSPNSGNIAKSVITCRVSYYLPST